MKIISLQFKNLNSLEGEWKIDFSNPNYISDGIFAITGATGAGKTTILDAICLALYGRTPRLSNVSASTNEIMSRKTGECYSEVVFETQKGKFVARWSQNRARNRADGNLQSPRFELSDFGTKKIISDKIGTTLDAIVERTGMDFGRFTKSVMLAQGGFAAFLQASANDRAPILEEITGTEIYSQLSILAYARSKEETERLKRLEERIGDVNLLDEEEKEEMKSELLQLEDFEKNNITQQEVLSKQLEWLKGVSDLEKKIQEDQQSLAAVDVELIAFAPSQKRLDIAMKAAEIESNYVQLGAIRKSDKDLTDKLKALTLEQPRLLNERERTKKAADDAKKQLEEKGRWSIVQRGVIDEVQKLDAQIVSKKKELDDAYVTKQSEEKQQSEVKAEVAAIDNKLSELADQERLSLEYLNANTADAALVEQCGGLRVELNSFEQEMNAWKLKEGNHLMTIFQNSQAFSKLEKDRVAVAQLYDVLQKRLAHTKGLEESRTNLLNNRTPNEYALELKHLQEKQLFMATFRSLEEHRKNLQDHEACPLCGALEHPFALGNVPSEDATKSEIAQLQALIAQLNELDKQIAESKEAYSAQNIDYTTAKTRFEANEKAHADAVLAMNNETQELAVSKQNLESRKVVLDGQLQPFGITIGEDIQRVIHQLEIRRATWIEHESTRSTTESKRAELLSLKQIQLVLQENNNKRINQTLVLLEEKQKEWNVLQQKRKELFGEKDTALESIAIDRELTSANSANTEAVKYMQEAESNLATNEKELKEIKNSSSKSKQELEREEADFNTQCRVSGFATEELFLQARLSLEQRTGLKEKADQLKADQIKIKSLCDENSKRLKVEKQKAITNQSEETVKGELSELKAVYSEKMQRKGGLKSQLEEEAKSVAQMGELLKEKEIQFSIATLWGKLSGLIGSSDGKKMRNFAQGLSFDLLLGYANKQLAKLTDRYALVRGTDETLTLNIIDFYKGGEERSTKNLSGGESFLISLSLALGLSHMSSSKMRVDSLFLDEGFGTLDEDTLETALNTLASLQQDGKLIGVISHISQLKDRINTKISIEKTTNGRSVMSGPGCSRVG